MDAIGDVHVRKVVAMMCAQAGKTEGLILNTIGFYMSYHPALSLIHISLRLILYAEFVHQPL